MGIDEILKEDNTVPVTNEIEGLSMPPSSSSSKCAHGQRPQRVFSFYFLFTSTPGGGLYGLAFFCFPVCRVKHSYLLYRYSRHQSIRPSHQRVQRNIFDCPFSASLIFPSKLSSFGFDVWSGQGIREARSIRRRSLLLLLLYVFLIFHFFISFASGESEWVCCVVRLLLLLLQVVGISSLLQ